MTGRKLFLILLLTFVAGWFAALFVAAMRPRGPELHELSGEGLVEARREFKLYKNNNIIQRIDVRLIDDYKLHVAIVQRISRALNGFVHSDDLPIHFWAIREGLKVYRFDDQHLFVVVSDWLVTDIERESAIHAKETGQTGTGEPAGPIERKRVKILCRRAGFSFVAYPRSVDKWDRMRFASI